MPTLNGVSGATRIGSFHSESAGNDMTTTQLVGVLTLVGTLLIAGMFLGRLQQQIEDHAVRIDRIERQDLYMHGTIRLPEAVR